MIDAPDTQTLATALETELRALAEQAPRQWRMRLLVAAHAAHLIVGDLAAPHSDDSAADPALIASIRAGAHDADLPALAAELRRRRALG
jgi:hypothetical protein